MDRDPDVVRDEIARLESKAEDAYHAGDKARLDRLTFKLDCLYREHARVRHARENLDG